MEPQVTPEKTKSKGIYDAFLCFFLYLIAVSMPSFGYVEQASFTAFLRFVALVVIVLLLFRSGFSSPKPSWKGLLLCFPLIVFCYGNMASLLFTNPAAKLEGDLLRAGVFTLITAVTEEVVFRFGFMEALKETKFKRYRILVSSLIFALSHAAALLAGSAPLSVLAQVGYTFLLGLFLGVAYELGGLLPTILIHFFFNFLQTDLFLAFGGGNWGIIFFACNGVCFLLSGAYGCLLYFRHIWPNRKILIPK